MVSIHDFLNKTVGLGASQKTTFATGVIALFRFV